MSTPKAAQTTSTNPTNQFTYQYSVVSSITFSVFMLAVIFLTRGRLGYRPTEEMDERVSSATQSEAIEGSIQKLRVYR